MELFCYADRGSQALHLNPFISAEVAVNSEWEAQPLWLESPVLPLIPDACFKIWVDPAPFWWLNLDEDWEKAVQVLNSGHFDLALVDQFSSTIEIPTSCTLQIEAETLGAAEVVLGISRSATMELQIYEPCSVSLEIGAATELQLVLPPSSALTIDLKEEAVLRVDAEACECEGDNE